MSGILLAAVRTGIQSFWGGVLGLLVALGINLSPEQSAAAVTLLTAVAIGLMTALIRWLETRTGDEPWQVWARRAAAILMLGMSSPSAQPTYGQAVVNVQAKDSA